MELRQYGVATTVFFPLIDKGFTDLEGTPVTIASGDIKISKDGGAFANTATASFVDETGGIYSIPLTATEMQAKQIILKIVDQTGTKEWEDQVIIITTVNHASAEIPSLWAILQSTASGAITSSSFAAGAIDAAAIATDAFTSLEFSDGATAEIAAAVWNLATAGHTTAGTFGAQLKTLLDSIAGYLDTEIAAIKAQTDLIPSDPADASVIAGLIDALPTAIENADALLTRDLDQVEASAPVHSPASGFLKLVARFVASTGRTYRTDGVTTHMTQTPTTDPSADAVVELGGAV